MKKQGILYATGGIVLGALTAFGVMQLQSNSSDGSEDNSALDQSSIRKRGVSKAGSDDTDATRLARRTVDAFREMPTDEAGNLLTSDDPEAKAQREKFRQDLRKRQIAQLTNKMAKWGAALGLDEGQQGKLLDLAEGQMDELEKLAVDASQTQDPTKLSESAKRAMDIISGNALQESMVAMLTPDQKEKYEAFKKQQNQNRAEVTALRELAGIQENIMLTPEQRNGVYSVLYEDAASKAGQNAGGVGSVIESMASSAGVNLDPAMQGIISSIANRGLEELAAGRQIDAETARRLSEEAATQALNQQVERFRPVMTPAQLDLYRSQLEDRMKGFTDRVGGQGNNE